MALDAATGKQLWVHDGIEGFALRGVNYWESADGTDRRLFYSARNILHAIDARTGKPIASFGTDGAVDLARASTAIPRRSSSRADLPGKVFENLLILGSTTNREYTSAPGDIRAYGRPDGRARVDVPHRSACRRVRRRHLARRTRATDVGGANDWAELSVDAARGIVYVPTGSAKYNFYGGYRHGDNLFANCLLALDARTGRRLWHFQTVHHDIWDLDNNSAPQLTTIRHDGRRDRRRRGGVEDRLSLRVRSRDGETHLADRRAARAAGRDRARRAAVADAAVPDEPAAVRRGSRSRWTISTRTS